MQAAQYVPRLSFERGSAALDIEDPHPHPNPNPNPNPNPIPHPNPHPNPNPNPNPIPSPNQVENIRLVAKEARVVVEVSRRYLVR